MTAAGPPSAGGAEAALRTLPRDGRLLFVTRCARMFAYGALSVVLVVYLTGLGLGASETGVLLTLVLVGDTVVSLYLTTRADLMGRRRMLIVGAVLMAAAGVAFASTRDLAFLIIAGTIGVISPSGKEVGPFLSIEQAALAHVVPDRVRTAVFAWYALAGSLATAAGSLCGGLLSHALRPPLGEVGSYRAVVVLYAAVGAVLAVLFVRLSPAVEVVSVVGPTHAPAASGAGEMSPKMPRAAGGAAADPPEAGRVLGISRASRGIVFRLSSLFALDAFAGGFVIQSFAAYWFYLRFGVNPATLGAIFFGANLLAGASALLAARLAARFGLVNTMVFTHLPSNVLLILVPLMPTLPLAAAVLLFRFSISQMDVPTRQSYTMAVVRPEERSAAAGVTGVARTTGAACAPLFAGLLFARPALIGVPFFLAGGLKIVYDLLLYRAFAAHRPPEEAELQNENVEGT
jgi:MFS family permease